MNRILLPRPTAFAVLALLLACSSPAVPPQARAAEDPHARYAPPAPRPADVVTPEAAARLARGGVSTIWVYFADKGETDAREFAAAVR
ncbi:MAG TPA: hypothetical protein VK527_02780, partial [Candidatus Limnocylindrales bacterium]|nr:hypothetical protein [Candidatus Limnocylindrales bacterium]